MRKFHLAIIIGVMLLLQACSTGESSQVDNESGKESKVLIVARKSDVTNLDPHFIVDVSTANVLYEKVYETLVIPNDNMEPQPHLATEWEQIDEKTWAFTLRDDVEFHDGTKFNADAVKKNFDRLLDPATASPQASKLGMIKEIEVVNDQHIIFHLATPYAPLLSILASNEGSILNPAILEKDPESLKKYANGTGPFVFEEWNSGQSVKLSKNKKYWGKEPKIDGVEFRIIPEDTTRLGMVERGEVHIMDQVPVNEIERVEASDSMDLYRNDGLGVEFIGFNVQKAPVDNVVLRKAISYAIDQEAILSGVFNNVGLLSNSTMSPKVFGYTDQLTGPKYDLKMAKQFLKESGVAEGTRLTLLTADRAERISLSEVVQSQLKEIGLEVDIKVLEYGAYIEANSNQEGHLFIGSWGNATGDGDYNQYNLFHSSSQGSSGNYQYYSNPTVDKLLDQARQESEPDKRKELYAETQQIELDDAAYVPIRSYENLVVYHPSVKGIKLNPIAYLMLEDVEITE